MLNNISILFIIKPGFKNELFLIVSILISSSLILKIFNITEDKIDFYSIKNNEYLKAKSKINKIDILFKKIDNND